MWIHLSPKKITKLVVSKQKDEPLNNKPTGIWFGWARITDGQIESEWLDFIGDERYEEKYFYEIEYDKRVLEVTSDDYLEILDKYKIDVGDHMPRILGHKIDWDMVSKDYNGIVFTDYEKSYNFFYNRDDVVFMFHDLLDMKSGCIWNPASITKCREL